MAFGAIYVVEDNRFKLTNHLGAEWTEHKRTFSLHTNQGIMGRAYRQNALIACNNVFEDKDYYHLFSEVRGMMTFPLYKNQEITAMAVLYHKEVDLFTPEIVSSVKAYVSFIQKLNELQEIKKQSKEREKENYLVQQASNAFLSTITHELRTPLHATMGMLEIIEKTVPQEEFRQYASLGYKSADQLLFLVNDILDYAKVKAGKLTIHNEETSLIACFEEAVTLMAEQAHSKGLDLFYRGGQFPLYKVLADRNRLKQVLQNLLQNAIKFTEKGSVTFSIDQVLEQDNNTHIAFSIKDSGIGIPPEKLQHIFEPFTQVHAAQTGNRLKGSGLGLAITRDLVSGMGGRVSAKSIEGQGSTFTVTIDFKNTRKKDEHSPQTVAGSRVLIATPKITAIDDCRSIVSTLRGSSYSAYSVESFESFVQSIEARVKSVNLVIVDEIFAEARPDLINRLGMLKETEKLGIIVTAKYNSPYQKIQKYISDKNIQLIRSPLLPTTLGEQLFKSYLPPSTNPPYSTSEDKAPYNRPKGVRLLLIEDNEVNRYIFTIQLKKLSIEPVVATNGKEALHLLKTETFDIVLFDIRLPDMTGYEILEELQKNQTYVHNRNAYTIAISANTKSEEEHAGHPVHLFRDFLSKPIRFEALQLVINQAKQESFQRSQILIGLGE